jgi:dephospho-CoA kinase
MIKVGLTGNIGSGKSTVVREFEKLGVPTYDTDSKAKEFLYHLDVNWWIYEKYPEVIDDLGGIDTKALGKFIFQDKEALSELESLIHPLVKKDFETWSNMKNSPYIIMECAILFEKGFDLSVDKKITVVCDEEIAIERVVKRDNTTGEKVRERLSNQISQITKASMSDYIIMNNDQDLTTQVKKIHKELCTI